MSLTIGQCVSLTCFWEATAPKPGNVHRGADFEDLTYPDLVTSGIVIAPIIERAATRRLGETVFEAVEATRAAVQTNANLGMILLLAPLAAVPRETQLAEGIRNVLTSLDSTDARLVYQAIGAAKAGGLGRVEEADIAGPPPDDLIAAMALAADRDLVARQYANGFRQVLDEAAPLIADGLDCGWRTTDAIVYAHLTLMSSYPDSLIARKCGPAVAQQAADRAAEVLKAGTPDDEAFWQAAADLDFWLRSDGHRRNPGTTADLISAGLFSLFRDGLRIDESNRR